MPWLPLYLLDSDISLLNDWLNKDDEAYFIQQAGGNQWKLTKEMELKKDGYYDKYRLWHLPSGPIPILKERSPSDGIPLFDKEEYEYVSNPFEPWPGRPASNLPGLPFFGDNESKVFTLTIRNVQDDLQPIPISGVEWRGNHYKLIGKGATESAEKWWKRLKALVKKNSTQIPRANSLSMKKEIFALPAAMEAIRNGRACSMN